MKATTVTTTDNSWIITSHCIIIGRHLVFSMSLSLPDDDESGPVIPASPQQGCKDRTRTRPAQAGRKTKSRKAALRSTLADSGAGLPPDDDDGPDLFSSLGQACQPPEPEPVPIYDVKDPNLARILQYDDSTLKLAAKKIPSQIEHPFDDLRATLMNLRPVDDSARCDLWEIFSLPRLQPVLVDLGGRCQRTYDIRHFFDLGLPALQRTLMQDCAMLQPKSLFLSPPCTWVSLLKHSNWSRVPREKRVINLVQACGLIDFSMWLAEHQVQSNNIFGFEHPGGSLAWERDSECDLTALDSVLTCDVTWLK